MPPPVPSPHKARQQRSRDAGTMNNTASVVTVDSTAKGTLGRLKNLRPVPAASFGCLLVMLLSCTVVSGVSAGFFDGVGLTSNIIYTVIEVVYRCLNINLREFIPFIIDIPLSLSTSGGFLGAFLSFACISLPVWGITLLIFVGSYLRGMNKVKVNKTNNVKRQLPPAH